MIISFEADTAAELKKKIEDGYKALFAQSLVGIACEPKRVGRKRTTLAQQDDQTKQENEKTDKTDQTDQTVSAGATGPKEPVAEIANQSQGPTKEALTEKLKELVNKKGMLFARDLLLRVANAGTLSKVTTDKYAEILAACDDALKEG